MYKKIDYKNLYLINEVSEDFKDGWHEVVCDLADTIMADVNGKKTKIYLLHFYDPITSQGILLHVFYTIKDFVHKPVLKMMFESFFKKNNSGITLKNFEGKRCKILTKQNARTRKAKLVKFAPIN